MRRKRRILVGGMTLGTRHPLPYFKCPECGRLPISEVPADLVSYYSKSYYAYTDRTRRRLDRP